MTIAVRIVCAIVALAVTYLLYRYDTSSIDLRSVMGTLAGVNATLLGFLVSAGALLYAIVNTRLARNLQRTGHFDRLVGDIFFDAAAFFAALSWTVVCLFVPSGKDAPDWQVVFSLVVKIEVFLTASAFLLLIPVGLKMKALLLGLGPDSASPLE